MISIDLSGKTAIVTGAARGIGKATALTLARAGAYVIVADVNRETGSKTVKEIQNLGFKSNFTYCDVTDLENMQRVVNEPDKLDIFVNIAGIMLTEGLMDAPPEKIERLFRVNVLGASNAYRAALERMIPQKSGKIVTMSSSAGRAGGPVHAHYRMSKAAIISLNQSAAHTAAPHGINVNTICPGIIRTEMWEDILDAFAKETGTTDREAQWKSYVDNSIPMGRAQTCEDIANGVLFLCSDLARNITGQALNICGGMCMN
jgi:NAD(P)-dependent dehydrogenase (short-subunit alcohol dehydrogenase family)